MEYTREEIEIFKRVIKDYEIIKKEIDSRISKGYKLEDLHDYIRHLSSCSISNYEENEYFDFYYCDTILTISTYGGLGLSDEIEIFNDEKMYHIGTFNNIKEIKDIIGDE